MTGKTNFLTPKEVSIILKVSVKTVQSLIKNEKLRAVIIGTGTKRITYRIWDRELDKFLAENYLRYENGN